MVAALLEVDQTTILPISLVSLAQNRVERLLKDFLKVKIGNRADNRALHSFNRVLALGCSVEVHREATAHGTHDLQHRHVRHTFNREADSREVEAPAKDLLAGRLDKLSARTSQL